MTRIKRWSISMAASAAVAAAVAAPASATPTVDYTWTGLTSMSSWSVAGNWNPGEPMAGGTLVFPDLGACSSPDTCYTGMDDIASLSVSGIVIDDTANYFIQSNNSPISIGAGGIQANATADGTSSEAGITPPIALTAPQTWTFGGTVNPAFGYPGGLSFGRGITGNEPLTLTANSGFASTNGSPRVVINGENSGQDSEVGTVTVENGVKLQFSLGPKFNVTDGQAIDITSKGVLSVVDEPAATGPIDVTDGQLELGGGGSPDGSLAATGDVTLDSSSIVDFFIDDNGSTPSTDYTQLSATGNISLGGSQLSLQQGMTSGSCAALAAGDTATLVSDSTGTISGTFSTVPNGAIVPMSTCGTGPAYPVRISYTTHAVTATVLSQSTTTTLAGPASATTTKPVTLTATVTGAEAPTGTVAFSDGAHLISGCGSVALTPGAATTATASCSASFTVAGAQSVTAQYGGNATLDSSTSGSLTVLVTAPAQPPPPGSGTPNVSAHVTTTKTSSGTPEVLVPVSCASGGASCTVKAVVTATETTRTGKRHKTKRVKTIVLGTATITINAGKTGRITVKLNTHTARKLAKHHKLRVKLTVSHRVNGKTRTLLTKFITVRV